MTTSVLLPGVLLIEVLAGRHAAEGARSETLVTAAGDRVPVPG